MDGFINSGSGLISSDGSDLNDMMNMNGMNVAGMISADDFNNTNNNGMLSMNNANNSAGLISAETEKKSVKPVLHGGKKTGVASNIKNKLNNIDAKSNSMQKKVPVADQSKPANTSVNLNAQQNTNNAANKLSAAVASGVKNAGADKPAINTSSVLNAPDVKEVRLTQSIQALSDAYVNNFKKAFDIDLIPSIVYENMTKMFHVDMGNKPMYYMCNTYRLSSIINLMEYFVPWIYSTFMFGNASSQNLKTYKDVIRQETELHAQSSPSELINVYKKRYMDRITDELYVDCIMITPGASSMSDDLMLQLSNIVKDMVSKSAGKLNSVYKINYNKLSEEDKANAKYVHSNFWYLLQIYEFNIADKRMSMTKTAIKAKDALKL